MANKNLDLAQAILDQLGGKDNIAAATNCMTRLHLSIKDDAKVDKAALKKVEGVMGIVESDPLQVVVGPGIAKKVLDEMTDTIGVPKDKKVTEDWQQNKDDIKKGQKQSPFKRALKTIAGIFIPMIPAIIAAGIFRGFSDIIGTAIGEGTLADTDFWNLLQQSFALIGHAFLGYFAIFTGVNAAKQFGATEALGGMIGAMSIAPMINDISEILGLYNADQPLESVLTTGKGGIIGVIFGVWILSHIEKRLRKFIPNSLDLILTPVIAVFVMVMAMVFVVMPVSGFVSDLLIAGLSVLIDSDYFFVNLISGYILAAAFLPMVLLGLHHGLIPLYAIQLDALGGVSLFPVLAMAGAGQVGAAIAIYIKAKRVKNDRMQKVISGALPAGVLGIGEPLIYGVTLPLGKPFITAGLGAGFGGAYVISMNVMANAWGPSGLVATPLMQSGSIVHYLIGIVISYIGGFIITHFFVSSKDVANV